VSAARISTLTTYSPRIHRGFPFTGGEAYLQVDLTSPEKKEEQPAKIVSIPKHYSLDNRVLKGIGY
jgi:hypothetical protein